MRYFLKGAFVLLIAIAMVFSSVAIAANTKEASKFVTGENTIITNIDNDNKEKSEDMNRVIIFQDDFESYEDFVLDFPPWTQYDGDGSGTYGMTDYDFPNEHYTGSYIIFNPSGCTPPVPDAPPHSGEKFVACFNAVLPAINDDWLFTPQLSSTQYGEVSFWARAYTDAYNLDRFEVGVSTTDTDPSSFNIISTPPYIEATVDWTEYVFDISAYSGDIYIGIHCVSNDAFFLMIDDFIVDDGQCEPSIDVEKYVQDPNTGSWIDADTEHEAADFPICEDITFKIVIHNDGDVELYDIIVKDEMHDSLKYISADPEPDQFFYEPPIQYMEWFFPGPLHPCETIEIYIVAHVEGPECSYDFNHVMVEAVGCGTQVQDDDYCWIHAYKKGRDINTPLLNILEYLINQFPLLKTLFGL